MAKLHPEDVLRTSPKDFLWTSLYGPLCNAKGRPLPTSWKCPVPTSLGRWSRTSWGRPHTALHVTPWDIPYRHLKDISCGHYEDDRIRSNIYFQETCPTKRPEDVPQRRTEDVIKTSFYGSITKAEKRPGDKDFCIWS